MGSMQTVIPKILVIDDVHANLKAMRVLLKDITAEVVTADSGNNGLALALEEHVTLILLDVNMPGMDGFEVAQLLSEMEETRNIPIIFITAFQHDEEKRLQGYNAGAIDYIQKPVNPDILLSKIHVFLKMWSLRFGLEQEISRRRKVEKEIEYLAQHDALTHLPNRRQLHIEIERMIDRTSRTKEKFAVLFLDLDGFKRINDELGHEAGDAFLKDVAKRFRSQIRSFDVIARYGGDEFIVLLSDLSDSLALTNRLKQLTAQAQQPFFWEGNDLKAGVSIGVSVFPDHGRDGDTLIKRADAAMYLAKDAGRNTFRFYTDALNNSLQRRLLLERHIQDSLNNEELEVYYQPIVNASDGVPVGAESLLRWNNQALGVVSPAEFIPVAESCGMIHQLGIWVLRQSVATMQRCPGIAFSVNASALQFNDNNLCAELVSLLESGSLAADKTAIEITEGLLLSNTDDVDARLEQIREMGIGLSIDDFGTGYSALGYLKRCPVNRIKIDRTFVAGIPEDMESVALVQAIIAMGHALGLEVIAEGVETEQQWHFLRDEGCDMAQGYYFSLPLPQKEFIEYLQCNR
ncbi:putative bifunctional diguanylate cyclase/phosphodiesterase [Aliamphritea ceti]|uniref:putative bifunctional diguanylate cyclase/phosphodiesterase n=1 Tax=Aliamphritea ceti TaxID=1524258 RepID=UPI0021C2BDF0|nr:EAL domain-containing protein [Aliamphritea ceti]